MIIGIGSDLVDIRRIEKTLEKFGHRFINKVFTHFEQTRIQTKSKKASSYAKLFAAKEALLKALGTGFSQGISWQHIEIQHLVIGKPILVLKGRALEIFQNLIPQNKQAKIDLSLSDDYPYAQAFVILSCY